MVLDIERHLLSHFQLEMNKKKSHIPIVYMYNDDNDIKKNFISRDVAISGFHLYWLLIVNMQFLCLSIENARFIIFVARSLRTKDFLPQSYYQIMFICNFWECSGIIKFWTKYYSQYSFPKSRVFAHENFKKVDVINVKRHKQDRQINRPEDFKSEMNSRRQNILKR